MLHRLRLAALFVFALSSSTGCYAGAHHHGGGGNVAFAAGMGLLAGVAIAEAHHEPRRVETVYYQPVVYVNAPPADMPLPPPRDRATKKDDGPGFDAARARTALGAVDLAPCRAAGAPRGYGHAKITFNPDGKASKVVVDTPDGLSDPAVKCIGDRLGAVTVPEFEGSLVTVGTSFFVP
jgi:hypothetical protein